MRGGSPHPPRKTGANPDGMRRESLMAADRSEVYNYNMLDHLSGMDRGKRNAETTVSGAPMSHARAKEDIIASPDLDSRVP